MKKHPNKSNQLVRVARVINHCDGLKYYALMILAAEAPDMNHIYYRWVTKYTGNLKWARAISKQYGLPIEDLTK